MSLTPDLSQRNLVPEKMDDPALPHADHQRALRGLRRINWFSGTLSQFDRVICELNAKNVSKEPVVILDIGCANGENAIGLYHRLAPKFPVSVHGWDISPYAIEQADKLRKKHGLSEHQCRFELRNALEVTPLGNQADQVADIVINSLFLHHFEASDVVKLLARMRVLARRAVICDDLLRTRTGWLLAKLGCHLLSRSKVVHFDGPQSVRAAFTMQELKSLADQAGLNNARFSKHWPERCSVIWERNNQPQTLQPVIPRSSN
jgi:SAM-dependent methyltransferase